MNIFGGISWIKRNGRWVRVRDNLDRAERLSLKTADRISKADWCMRGGLTNPRLARVTRGKSWAYYWLHS